MYIYIYIYIYKKKLKLTIIYYLNYFEVIECKDVFS